MAQSRRKGRSGAALFVSVAVHGVVLILLARAIPIMPAIAPGRDVQIDLVSASPLTRFATPVSRAAANAAASAQGTPEPADATAPLRRTMSHPRPAQVQLAEPHPAETSKPSRTTPAQHPTAARPPASAPSRPSLVTSPPVASSTAANSAASHGLSATARPSASPLSDTQPGDEASGGVTKFLRRTVGCSHQDFAHLTVAERFECERENGVQASIGGKQKLDALPANKRAYYDSVQEAYKAMRDYTPLDTGAGGQGAHMPGHGLNYSCVHGKCGLNLPQGAGTEESGIPPPQ